MIDDQGCATTWQGDLWQWGGWAHRTAHGTAYEILLPTPLKGTPLDGQRVVSVALGFYHCLALTDDGTVFSWACYNPSDLGTAQDRIRTRGA